MQFSNVIIPAEQDLLLCQDALNKVKIAYSTSEQKLSEQGYTSKCELDAQGCIIFRCSHVGAKPGDGINPGCYIFLNGREITISFRGTQNRQDVWYDVQANLTKVQFLENSGYVHTGFYQAFESLREEFVSQLDVAINYGIKQEERTKGHRITDKDFNIRVVGHSLGEALAQITALYLYKERNIRNLQVVTFGSPRVFDYKAAQTYGEYLKECTLNVVNNEDAVPYVTSKLGDYGLNYIGAGTSVDISLSTNPGWTRNFVTLNGHRVETYRRNILYLIDCYQVQCEENEEYVYVYSEQRQALPPSSRANTESIDHHVTRSVDDIRPNSLQEIDQRNIREQERSPEEIRRLIEEARQDDHHTITTGGVIEDNQKNAIKCAGSITNSKKVNNFRSYVLEQCMHKMISVIFSCYNCIIPSVRLAFLEQYVLNTEQQSTLEPNASMSYTSGGHNPMLIALPSDLAMSNVGSSFLEQYMNNVTSEVSSTFPIISHAAFSALEQCMLNTTEFTEPDALMLYMPDSVTIAIAAIAGGCVVTGAYIKRAICAQVRVAPLDKQDAITQLLPADKESLERRADISEKQISATDINENPGNKEWLNQPNVVENDNAQNLMNNQCQYDRKDDETEKLADESIGTTETCNIPSTTAQSSVSVQHQVQDQSGVLKEKNVNAKVTDRADVVGYTCVGYHLDRLVDSQSLTDENGTNENCTNQKQEQPVVDKDGGDNKTVLTDGDKNENGGNNGQAPVRHKQSEGPNSPKKSHVISRKSNMAIYIASTAVFCTAGFGCYAAIYMPNAEILLPILNFSVQHSHFAFIITGACTITAVALAAWWYYGTKEDKVQSMNGSDPATKMHEMEANLVINIQEGKAL